AEGLVLHMIWVPPFSRRLLDIHNYIIQPSAFVRRAAVAPMLLDQTCDSAMRSELWRRLSERGRIARVDRVLSIARHHAEREMERPPDVGALENESRGDACDTPSPKTRAHAPVPLTIAARFAGLRLVIKFREEHVSRLRVDSLTKLVIRQTLRHGRGVG